MEYPCFVTNREIDHVITHMAEVARYLWEKGWAERNAGNMSVNITGIAGRELSAYFTDLPLIPFHSPGYHSGGNIFLLTATGSRMRDLARKPEEHLCFVRIDDAGSGYRQFCLCPECAGNQPTSEFPTHVLIQEMLLTKPGGHKALVHTHATELIALTQIAEFTTEKAINRLLWSMHPETVIFVPEGIGLIPYTIPGTKKIALATRKGLEKHRVVIWEKHGVFATGTNVLEAFDLIDLLVKAATIFFHCRNAGFDPEGLSDVRLREIRKAYDL